MSSTANFNRHKNKIKMKTKFDIGDRVITSKEPEGTHTYSNNATQKKQLEIVEFLANDKVKCRFFFEVQINPNIEFYILPVESLELVSKNNPLIHKGLEHDPWFKENAKKK